ncbi:MAG: hypothetical protein JWR03_2548 [Cohnella sp.]|nr:hypothetical protein [Cohnella sp.]
MKYNDTNQGKNSRNKDPLFACCLPDFMDCSSQCRLRTLVKIIQIQILQEVAELLGQQFASAPRFDFIYDRFAFIFFYSRHDFSLLKQIDLQPSRAEGLDILYIVLFQKIFQSFAAARMTKLAESLGFDLTNALTRDAEYFADLFQGPGTAVIQPEAKAQHIFFPLG